jgi:hypothetical protein
VQCMLCGSLVVAICDAAWQQLHFLDAERCLGKAESRTQTARVENFVASVAERTWLA